MVNFLKRRKQPDDTDLDKLINHISYLFKLRKPIVINDNFSKEEYHNTLYYASNLISEDYEKLSKFNYKII